jgi:hypothetical protein
MGAVAEAMVKRERPSIKGPRRTTNRQVPWSRKHKKKFYRKFKKKLPRIPQRNKKREGKKVSVNRKECCDRAGREDLGLPEGRRVIKKKKAKLLVTENG